MKRIKTALALFSVWALLLWPVSKGVRAQEIFNDDLTMPIGVSTDASGDVNIHSRGISTTLLTKFTSDNVQLIQTTIGSGSIDAERFRVSHLLATDPDPLIDRLYLLSHRGDVVVFVSSTLQEVGRFNISQDLTVDTSDVYDVATEDTTSTFVLDPLTTYGDIAAFRPSDGSSSPAWFVTGLSNGLAFVMRIPMQAIPESVTQAEVILASTEPSPITLEQARGVAVNANGDGLTTLPLIGACPDKVIHFRATEPFLDDTNVFEVGGTAGVPSWGMDTDVNGNFYLTTGGVGNTDCFLNSGHVVIIPHNLAGIDPTTPPIPLPSFPTAQPMDVAVSFNSSSPVVLIYVTIPIFNTVARLATPVIQLP